MSRRRGLAIGCWIVTVAASLLALAIVVATRDLPVETPWGYRGLLEAFALTCGTVGVTVAMRRPENVNGWLFCTIGLAAAAAALSTEYVVAGVLVVPGGLPWTTGFGWLLTWIWVPPVGLAFIFLPLLFPTGMLVSRRWRAVAALGVVAVVAFSAAAAFVPGPVHLASFVDNPLGARIELEVYARVVVGPAAAMFLMAIILALASLVVRFRRASVELRLQIKWVALAVVVAGATFTSHTLATFALGSLAATEPIEALLPLSVMALPTAAGMAILRYRLYDIDRIVSRTISYAVVTGLLVAMFLLMNVALQALVSPLTSSSALAVAGSTLLAAALFSPLRLRVQRLVDRRFDRARYDSDRTAAAFAAKLRNDVDLPSLANELNATVDRAMAPKTIGLWLRGSGR